MKRHLFSLGVAILSSLLLLAQTKVDNMYYNFDGSNASLSYKAGDDYSGDIVIPSTFEYGSSTYTVTSIESGAFSFCSGLTSVEIPNTVTTIGSNVFENCSQLTGITIPQNVTSLGKFIFNGSAITTITMETVTPPTTEEKSFYNFQTSNVALIIPTGTKTVYNVAPWTSFKSITEIDEPKIPNSSDPETAIQTLATDKTISVAGKTIAVLNHNNAHVAIFNIMGKCVAKGNGTIFQVNNPGIHIVTINGKSYKVLVK